MLKYAATRHATARAIQIAVKRAVRRSPQSNSARRASPVGAMHLPSVMSCGEQLNFRPTHSLMISIFVAGFIGVNHDMAASHFGTLSETTPEICDRNETNVDRILGG